MRVMQIPGNHIRIVQQEPTGHKKNLNASIHSLLFCLPLIKVNPFKQINALMFPLFAKV